MNRFKINQDIDINSPQRNFGAFGADVAVNNGPVLYGREKLAELLQDLGHVEVLQEFSDHKFSNGKYILEYQDMWKEIFDLIFNHSLADCRSHLADCKTHEDFIFRLPCHRSGLLDVRREINNLLYEREGLEGLGVCKKCKSTKLYRIGKQTRSADEGETVFFSCTQCGFEWRA